MEHKSGNLCYNYLLRFILREDDFGYRELDMFYILRQSPNKTAEEI